VKPAGRREARGAGMRPAFCSCALFLGFLFILAGRAAAELKETPYFAARVARGVLPPVAERVPRQPAIAQTQRIGKPGGTLRLLMASPKDTKMMAVYGYARLVSYTPSLTLVPDILQSIDVKDGRIFTLHLRRGMKWSDGAPFTAEDFRFWWEDVAQNRELSPEGPPDALLPQGEAPRFKVLGRYTVRYSWDHPNPLFLPALAGADPIYIYCPAHYLKQFHARYQSKAKLEAMVEQKDLQNWAGLYDRMARMYRNDNPRLPTLDPWILKTKPPSSRYIFARNPYYYRIDTAGHQLPYIDRVIMTMADATIIPAKTAAGESDLQARYLNFDDYTFLKSAEKRSHYEVRLWRTGPGSQLALYPNLNVKDPVWRKLVRNTKFRRALSLAIDRHEINEAIYFGLAIEGQNTLLPQSPLYKPQYRKAWASYDLKKAGRLLDELGLTRRNSDGVRLLPDGRPMDIVVETSGQSADQVDVLELIRDSWRHIGVRLFVRPLQLTLFRRRVFAGYTLMSIDKGIEDGLATADTPPSEFAPTSEEQLEWPQWGQYAQAKGLAGKPPQAPSVVRLERLYEVWMNATTESERAKIWEEMLRIWADEVFTIGLVAEVPQPVVVNDRLRGVPKKGMYNWTPGAYFGMYKADTFWFGRPARSAKARPGAQAVR
jgi:peptide/nickel transport system substrate-binding protein